MCENVIETFQLCKKHGSVFRVKDIHLAVPKGCIYGFLGPNGAGKTTTMKLILGLIQPSQGTIRILGKEVTSSNRIQMNRCTGSLIESPSYYGHLTGQENLEIIARYKQIPVSEVGEALNIVHLYDRKDEKVKQYSLGMKQRLGIAMALLGRPQVLILDEPTNGLDPAGIQEIRGLIKSMPARYNMTVFISSHLLSEVEHMADYIGIINHGELIYQGARNHLEINNMNLEEIFLSLTGGAK